MCLVLRSDQNRCCLFKSLLPRIHLAWVASAVFRASLYWLCCSPALSQPSGAADRANSHGVDLAYRGGSDGTSVSWRGSTIPAPKEDFPPTARSRGIFDSLCGMRSLCSVNVSPSVCRQWMSRSGCDIRSQCLRCCAALLGIRWLMYRQQGAVSLR